MRRLSPRTVARRALRRVPTSVREPLLDTVGARRHASDIERIVSSGAFDLPWYEAQTGRTFPSPQAACLDYLRVGRRQGFSPHPLFEPSIVDPKRWAKSGTDPLVSNLAGKTRRTGTVHLAGPPEWAGYADGVPAWLDWLRASDESTLMPVADDGAGQVPVTWGQFRARALAVATELHRTRTIVAAPRVGPQRPPGVKALAASAHRDGTPDAPLVSIVLPTWNRGAMIRRAIESVQAQTLQDWELVVVDDGSTDDTLLVLEGISHWDPRVRVIAAPHGGVCRARNTAIDAANGRFLAFLDSDNTWNVDFLERAVAFMVAEKTPWAHAAMQLEGEQGTTYRALEGDLEHLLIANYIDLNVLIAERSAVNQVGGFDESLRRAVDYDLVLKLCTVSAPRLIPMIGAVYTDDDDDTSRISVTEPMAWNQVVRIRHLVDPAAATDREPVTGRISVILPVRNLASDLVTLVDTLRSEPGDIEVVLVTAGPNYALVRMLELAALSRPGVSVVRWPARNLDVAGLIDLGAQQASGELLAVWAPHHWPYAGWSAALTEALERPGVAVAQPLVVNYNGTVNSAGAVFVGTDPAPSPLLSGCPIEDAESLGTRHVPAALGGTFLVRRRHFWALAGLDPIYANDYGEVDLSIRAAAAGSGSTVVCDAARVRARSLRDTGFKREQAKSVDILRARHAAPAGSSAAWDAVGFEQVGRRVMPLNPDDEDDVELSAIPVVRPRVHAVVEGQPSLRWAIDIAAPAGERGLAWGDTHFAGSLADSLRALGQWVHVDRREAREGPHRDYDDVTLVIRGLDLVVPRPGDVSLLWIISHPDMVSADECAKYDHVFAASVTWANEMSERWAMPVESLPQCTDARLFRPDAGEPDSAVDVVFVGNARGTYRPALRYAIESGVAPAVYGGGWTDLIPQELIRGTYLPNAELPALYASAGVVLNDHWEDMRRGGFVSNRIFDVLACAGRIVSDNVAGLDEMFGDTVRTFDAQRDVARLLTGATWRDNFPDRAARVRTAELVRSEHTFDARARTLLDAALHRRAAIGSVPTGTVA